MAAVVAESDSELSCVLIPLVEEQLLLPNVTIAEILPWRRVKPLADAPDWCLGVLGWRGEAIPVVRYELLNNSINAVRRAGRCMIVMNRARLAGGLPFYALAAEGLPRLLQLEDEDLENLPRRLGPAETVAVKVGTENAAIPNLDFIEEKVRSLRPSRKGP